jgi:hypothetical protein
MVYYGRVVVVSINSTPHQTHVRWFLLHTSRAKIWGEILTSPMTNDEDSAPSQDRRSSKGTRQKDAYCLHYSPFAFVFHYIAVPS